MAKAAGVSRPTVYGHFPDRTRLLEALVERAVGRAADAIASAAELSADAMRRAHTGARAAILALVERGRREGTFRTDVPPSRR